MWADKNLNPVRSFDIYVDSNGTRYPWNYPKGEIPGLFKVKESACPEGVEVTGFVIDKNFQQVWITGAKINPPPPIVAKVDQAKIDQIKAAVAVISDAAVAGNLAPDEKASLKKDIS